MQLRDNKRIVICCLTILFLVFLIFPNRTEASGDIVDETDKISITFYYNNACASCHEEKVFEEVVKKGLKDLGDTYPHEVWIINCFQPANYEQFQEDMAAHNWEDSKPELPLMVIGNHAVSGVEDMKKQITDLFLEEVKIRLQQEELIFFSTYECKDCERVRQFLEKYALNVVEYNINEDNNTKRIYQYFKEYQVPTEKQQVPILFQGERYLSGADEIIAELMDGLDISKSEETEFITEEEPSPVFSLKDSGKVVVTGLINGLNPCSASMLLFLLSLFVISGISLRKVGFCYLSGRFFAYMAMGLGFYSLGTFMKNGVMSQIMSILQWIFLILAVILGTMNLFDFIHAKRQEYGKIRVQLPKFLRHWNQERIRRVQNIPSRWLMPGVFLLGFVISAGEFFCTGQIYVAVILYMIRIKTHLIQAIILLVIYVFAMCIPHAVIISCVDKSKNVMKVSGIELKQMPLIKLLNVIVFWGFALWILYTM